MRQRTLVISRSQAPVQLGHFLRGSSTLGPTMPPLDNLPGDQRAVLEMVLKRGRSYDDIAQLLSLDRAKVRERAQIALDTIGPHTEVAPEHQHRIADYLLGQLPEDEVTEVRDLLADSPTDRAWARVVASELAPLADDRP